MDDVEPIELVEEGLDDLSIGEPCTISVTLCFKSGLVETLTFRGPTWVPIYTEPITGSSVFEIISAAYSYGEAPFLALPLEDDTFRFVDLSSVNFVDVKVSYD